MAAKSSNLEDRMSGANLQMEGHMDVPSQSAKDPRESGTLGSSPSHSPSLSPTRRLPLNGPNTRHCLEIHVTLTKQLGAVPLPSHAWMAPLVEDILHDARTSLTKAVVMGPGRAILFYGRHSLGEGLTLDEARDVAFLFTRAGTWVRKPAYLAADPMTIQEGQWAITQAITDCQVKARGPGHPHVNLLTQQPFNFDCPRDSPRKDTPRDVSSDHQPSPCPPSRGWDHTGIRGTIGNHHIGYHHPPQTMGSKVIGAHYQKLHWCHPCHIDQRDPGVPDVEDDTGRMEPIWR